MPRQLDYVLAAVTVLCPKYEAMLAKYLEQSKEVQLIYTKYAGLFPYLSRMSGSNITTIFDVFDFYDTLKIEKEQNKMFVYAQ